MSHRMSEQSERMGEQSTLADAAADGPRWDREWANVRAERDAERRGWGDGDA